MNLHQIKRKLCSDLLGNLSHITKYFKILNSYEVQKLSFGWMPKHFTTVHKKDSFGISLMK